MPGDKIIVLVIRDAAGNRCVETVTYRVLAVRGPAPTTSAPAPAAPGSQISISGELPQGVTLDLVSWREWVPIQGPLACYGARHVADHCEADPQRAGTIITATASVTNPLPHGWTLEVNVDGPGGTSVTIGPGQKEARLPAHRLPPHWAAVQFSASLRWRNDGGPVVGPANRTLGAAILVPIH